MAEVSEADQAAIDAFVTENSANEVELFTARLYKMLGDHVLKLKSIEAKGMEKSQKGKALNASLIYTFEDVRTGREISHRVFNNHERVWKQENLDIWSALLPGAAVDMAIDFDGTMRKLLTATAAGEPTPLTGQTALVSVYKGEPNDEGFAYTEYTWSPEAVAEA